MHETVVYDNKLWVLGGSAAGGDSSLNDAWCTGDGETWTRVESAGPHWSPRERFAAVVLNKKLWVAGGWNEMDIWYTDNATELIGAPYPSASRIPLFRTVAPNPFQSTVGIGYRLDRPGAVRISIYDRAGREIAVVCNQLQTAGPHTLRWNGLNREGNAVANGSYLLRCKTKDATEMLTIIKNDRRR